ncbi:hypothetical protein [Clostridium sp.]|uniref:hypothetical protein n=1 Tax=Clostridium sp. TaxID=1506 RepID=UPI003463D7B6
MSNKKMYVDRDIENLNRKLVKQQKINEALADKLFKQARAIEYLYSQLEEQKKVIENMQEKLDKKDSYEDEKKNNNKRDLNQKNSMSIDHSGNSSVNISLDISSLIIIILKLFKYIGKENIDKINIDELIESLNSYKIKSNEREEREAKNLIKKIKLKNGHKGKNTRIKKVENKVESKDIEYEKEYMDMIYGDEDGKRIKKRKKT